MSLTHSPKQTRSQQTQERLLQALERLLAEQYFDQLTIRDIAAEAGVAVGTVYRRFKDKEALLPVLYQRYEDALQEWLVDVWSNENLARYSGLRQRLHHVIAEQANFFVRHRGIMRTVHMYARLRGDLSEARSEEGPRPNQYRLLLTPVFECLPEEPGSEQQRTLIMLLISGLTEGILYDDVRPAKLLQLPVEQLVDGLTDALEAYLCSTSSG